MSKLGKITEGEWKLIKIVKRSNDKETMYDSAFEIRTEKTKVCDVEAYKFWNLTLRESEANAKLIADAGTTAQKSGKLPSELLKERDELLEVLKDCLSIMESLDLNDFKEYKKANKIIQSIEK